MLINFIILPNIMYNQARNTVTEMGCGRKKTRPER